MSHASVVDTHLLYLPDTDKPLMKECLQSLEGEPIVLHQVEGIPGHVGNARAKGFRCGNSPYVSFVDPDDLVVPGAFQACIDTLEANPEACGTYTDEVLIDKNGEPLRKGMLSERPWNPLQMLEPHYMHHILVMRREYVEQYLDELSKWPNMPEFILKALLTQNGPWVHTDRIGYKWRVDPSLQSTHRNMPISGVNAARWRVIPLLYMAAQTYQSDTSAVQPTGNSSN